MLYVISNIYCSFILFRAFKEVLKNILVISILFSIFGFCVTVLDFAYKRTLDCFFPLTVCVMFLCFGLVFF